jgi:hypothetical protein
VEAVSVVGSFGAHRWRRVADDCLGASDFSGLDIAIGYFLVT